MGNEYVGLGKQIQIGEETTYGTLATPTMALFYDSEDLKFEVEKKPEESMLASKTIDSTIIKGYSYSGSISLTLKPENFGILKFILKETALPTEVTTGVNKHTLVALSPGEVQKSFSLIEDKGVAVEGYTGVLVDSVSFSGEAGEPIKVKVTVKGRGQKVTATLATLDNPSLSSLSALSGVLTIGGTTIDDITQSSVEIGQGLSDGKRTHGTGLYKTKPVHGRKDIKVTFDAFYNEITAPLITNYCEKNDYVAYTIEWASDSLIAATYPYKIKFTMPKVSLNPPSNSISGPETIMASFDAVATGNDGSEPVTVEVWDNVASKY